MLKIFAIKKKFVSLQLSIERLGNTNIINNKLKINKK